MNYQKLQITAGRQPFKSGTILGLTTNAVRPRASALEKVSDGIYKVAKPVSFGAGEIIFMPIQKYKEMTGKWEPGVVTKELDMSLDYGERDAESELMTEKAIAHLDLPEHSRQRAKKKAA